jgi:hypothetical protein
MLCAKRKFVLPFINALCRSSAPPNPDDAPIRAELETRKDAVRAAVVLLGRGLNVTITDEDGRTYPPADFHAFFRTAYQRDQESVNYTAI